MPCIFKSDMHHTWLCIMPCYVMVVYCVVCFFPVLLFGLVPITSRLWGSVRQRLFVFFVDLFFFLARSQARWPYPWNHFYLCLLVVRSIAMLCYLPLAISCLPYCHEPLTFVTLPSKPLFGYVTALLSPSYSVASCRWRWRLLHVGLCYVGISQYLLYY